MQQRSEETRTRILEAVTKQIASKGFSAASVEDICRAAGVSKGAFYHHFASKQAVFIELLDTWLSRIDASLEAARQASVPLTLIRMTESLPQIIASASGYLPVFLEFWLQASHDETIWGKVIAPYQHYQEYFARLIEEGMAEGSLRPVDPQATAQMIVSLAVGMFLQALVATKETDWQKMAQQSMEIMMRGLTP